ncbi:MAG: hypothetical protein WCA16_09975, partial [Candidatus Sulfotelmatobacter sp.]
RAQPHHLPGFVKVGKRGSEKTLGSRGVGDTAAKKQAGKGRNQDALAGCALPRKITAENVGRTPKSGGEFVDSERIFGRQLPAHG